MTKQQIKAAADVIRRRCCRAADGRDIGSTEADEIATAALRAAEQARNVLPSEER